ncbi:ankyrin repeat-containing domain protein, partial [Morchella snyderi]
MFSIYGGHLQTAVRQNDIETVKRLIAMGADVNQPNKNRLSCLATAISERNPDIVKLLLESGVSLDTPSGLENIYPLRFAAQTGHLGIVKALLDHGAEVDAQSGEGSNRGTALYGALAGRQAEAVKLLIQRGADPLVRVEGNEVCLEAAVYTGAREFVDLFLSKGANPNTSGITLHGTGNAVMDAAFYRKTNILLSLLAKGADPNIQLGKRFTALQAAINPGVHRMWGGQGNVVQILLDNGAGAGIEVPGGEYGGALQAAACSMDTALVRLLLDAGAAVNLGGGPHGSPLQAAVVWNDDCDIIQLLLDRGADPNFIGDSSAGRESALALAVKKGNEKQVELLLRGGA